jgi:hypothetical protein
MAENDRFCMVCHAIAHVRHIPLYVVGSEGLWICHACDMMLVACVQGLMRALGEQRKQRVLAEKLVAQERGTK